MSTNASHWVRQTSVRIYESLPIFFLLLSFYCRWSTEVPLARRWRSVITSHLKRLTDCRPFIKYFERGDRKWLGYPCVTFSFLHRVCLFSFRSVPLIVTNSDICTFCSQKHPSHSDTFFEDLFEIPRTRKIRKVVSMKISKFKNGN